MTHTAFLPCETVSITNRREHWARRAERARSHRQGAMWTIKAASMTAGGFGPPPYEVTLTRVGPRPLDDDNLRGALKSVRDGIADAFGMDDRDPRVTWLYGQRKAPSRFSGVEIAIRAEADAKRRPGPSSRD